MTEIASEMEDFEEDKVLEEYRDYSDKLLWLKPREQFAKNITPIMFIKNQGKRSNFKYDSIDSYSCKKEDVLSNKFEPNKLNFDWWILYNNTINPIF